MSESSIGMMEGAFFVPKSEILNWINNLLQLNLTKIEQLGSGSAYCQVIDVLYPGSVKLSRVSWKARNEWEFIVNLKILQQAFQKNNIKKYIEIEKLSKAKYQDNLEFAQWMKRFFDLNNGSALAKDYDAVAKRGNAETEFSFLELRDNSRMAAMRGARNDDSADQKGLRKKIGARSKSPITKPIERSLLGGNKGRGDGNKISKQQQATYLDERDMLLAKFNEIQAILLAGSNPSDKLREISEISQYVESLNLKPSQEEATNQFDQDESSVSYNRQSMDRFQHENIIKEEDSPRSQQSSYMQPPQSKSALGGQMISSKNSNGSMPSNLGNQKKQPKMVADANLNGGAQNGDDYKFEKKIASKDSGAAGSFGASNNAALAAKKSAALARVNKHSEALKIKQ